MILGNYTFENRNIQRVLGAAYSNSVSHFRPWLMECVNFAEDYTVCEQLEYSGNPDGYNTEYSYRLPMHSGGIGSVNNALATGSLSASGARGFNLALTGGVPIPSVATLNATGQLVVSGAATITSTATVTATAKATKAAASTITSTATATGTLLAKGNIAASLTGTATISATRYGKGVLEAAILPYTELSPQNLATAVWDEPLETNYAARELMRLITSALAGKISGAAGTTVTIRDVNDSKNRIVATVDGSGNRTTITLDVTE